MAGLGWAVPFYTFNLEGNDKSYLLPIIIAPKMLETAEPYYM
jgi:hypothetical protein